MERDRDALQAALDGYELGDELGRGGWGIVYAAVHRRLGRTVAVKMLPRAFAADPEVRARFEDEAQFAARLSHPHVVPVFDFVDRSGVLAIVMERLDARTLADRFSRDGVLQDTACAVAIAVASALHAAHRFGRVHRDVKPENVLFDGGNVPKLGDFGVAKIIGIGIGDGRTRAGDVVGTPAYMSPEQARAGNVGPASDVYSTSVLTYELLAGRLPFAPTDSAVTQLYQHVHEPPVPLGVANPSVPEPIAAAVMRGLAKDPAERYVSAEAFAVAIGRAAMEAFGSGWLRDVEVELRIGGDLLETFRTRPGPVIAQRLPALTTRLRAGEHPRLGTVVESAPSLGAEPQVEGFALHVESRSAPTEYRHAPTEFRAPVPAPVPAPAPPVPVAPAPAVAPPAPPAPVEPAVESAVEAVAPIEAATPAPHVSDTVSASPRITIEPFRPVHAGRSRTFTVFVVATLAVVLLVLALTALAVVRGRDSSVGSPAGAAPAVSASHPATS